ncbi:MAG: purine-nucleoside phosphorylase [Sulfurovum sp.]|nr:MAG: purine-nucleoside phosphorylase [Sulfurovum sp.]
MIICAGQSEQFNFATPIGIGMTDVAINLTQLCMLTPPKFLLFVGTAGSYGEKKIFDIVESRTAANIENSFFTGGSYTPIDNVVSTAEDVSRETLVNSSNYITTDGNMGKHYLSKNIGLENMEFYAVLKVAKKFGISAGGVFVVTNYCNENAHRDFMANQKEAMRKLTEYMRNVKQS